MNNDKNSHHLTPSGTTAHPEQTVPDNIKFNQYKVILRLKLYGHASAIVKATSRGAAKMGAKHLQLEDVDGYEINNEKMEVESVILISEGQSHE